MTIRTVDACRELGVNDFYIIGEPTNETEFNQMFKKIVGKDENKHAIISESPSDFGVTYKQIREKITELENAEPMRLLRLERNQKLSETDWWCASDRTPTQAQLDYRKSLRDLPSTASPSLDKKGQLTGVKWPNKPN